MISLPWWLSAILAFLSRAANDYAARRRAEGALRDLGAKTQAEDSRREAERQEAVAKAAGDAAAAAPEDPADPFLRKG
ncbi:peptidoglycan-binding protein [Methylobacterium aquaticum]|uniref:peptidoglycan-binding protein n=1 Tax=Methylobacterium aquaticum TaxID=270351 RepID=UPI0019320392|nr:peptidoglycan-binding protein [Methylobacterium aquaticum]QRE77335.1 peptidoglycan-binding protein [Methylobacterium aquaticum]